MLQRAKQILVTLALLLAFQPAVHAALPSYTLSWEVHHAGDNTNGGCFDSAKSGTDFTQQDPAQQAYTDLVATSTTTITSAGRPFSSVDVGNCIHIASGTGWTVGWFEITSVASVTATMDRAIATNGSTGGTGKEGGALATIGQGNTNLALAIGGELFVKADATYGITTNINVDTGATIDGIPHITGYTTTRGDGGQVTVQATSGFGSDTYMLVMSGSPTGSIASNFILDCNGLTATGGFRFHSNGNRTAAHNIISENCTDAGFYWDGVAGMCDKCVTINTPKATAGTVNAAFENNNGSEYCFDCAALGSTVNSAIAFKDMCGGVLRDIIAANFSGTTTKGLTCTTQENDLLVVDGGIFYGFTGDVIVLGENTAIDDRPLMMRNLIITNSTGVCLKQTGTLTLKVGMQISDHIACNTTTGSAFYSGWPVGVGDITLSVDPFVSATANNFQLNNTAGGGASLRTAARAQTANGNTLNYRDLGPIQHQDTGGGGTRGTPIQ